VLSVPRIVGDAFSFKSATKLLTEQCGRGSPASTASTAKSNSIGGFELKHAAVEEYRRLESLFQCDQYHAVGGALAHTQIGDVVRIDVGPCLQVVNRATDVL
jgi:hypothetical protein